MAARDVARVPGSTQAPVTQPTLIVNTGLPLLMAGLVMSVTRACLTRASAALVALDAGHLTPPAPTICIFCAENVGALALIAYLGRLSIGSPRKLSESAGAFGGGTGYTAWL